MDDALKDLDLALEEPCLCGELATGCPFCDDFQAARKKISATAQRLQKAIELWEQHHCGCYQKAGEPPHTCTVHQKLEDT